MIRLNHGLYLEFLQSSGVPSPTSAPVEPDVPVDPPAASVPANSTIRVELPDKIKVQLVEKPTSRSKAQSPPPLTEDQIRTLMGDVSKLTDTEKTLRRYTVIKHGDRWRAVFPANAMEAAKHDSLYEKEVGVARWTISTWRRALDRKK